ncbi:hypothetical protein L218DRAFT_1001935 [Marasmius fiardii PR-910]|nr:hypothetical protein L218DRAFT_1001935 [Marasmius fiardii PR-910]
MNTPYYILSQRRSRISESLSTLSKHFHEFELETGALVQENGVISQGFDVTEPIPTQSLSKIDAQIFELEDALQSFERRYRTAVRSLRAQRNSFTGSHRLPTEILIEIFTYCTKAGRVDSDVHAKPKWLSFTHVCQRWRAVALHAPTLWTSPHFYHKELALEMIERAKDLPLEIEAHISRTTTRDVRRAVVQVVRELPRITKLQLQVPSSTVMERILANCTQPAPMLTSLELHISSAPRTRDNQFTLPDGFLGETAPNLTHLSLKGCRLRPDCPLLQNITFLRLHVHDLLPFSTYGDYRTILATFRRLEHFDLRVWKLAGEPMLADQQTRYHLTHLRHLYLESELRTCTNLMKMISLPETTTVHIEIIFFQQEQSPQIVQNFDLFSTSLPSLLSETSFTSFFVEGYDENWVQFKGWTSLTKEEKNNLLSTASTKPRLCLSLRDASFDHCNRVHWDLVLHGLVSRSFSLLSLETLSFQLGGEVFRNLPEIILRFFASLPNLTTLEVEIADNLTRAFVEVLTYDKMMDRVPLQPFQSLWPHGQTPYQDNAVDVVPTHNLAFPQLRVLRLDNVEVDALRVFTLATILGSRRDFGVGIETVQFYGCVLPHNTPTVLEEYVTKMETNSVTWT